MSKLLAWAILLLLLLLAAQQAASQDGTAPPSCFEGGECTFSPHVGDWTTAGAQDCLEQCRDYAGCLYFTYYEDEDLCAGFAGCQEFSPTSCDDCYSGNADCEDLTCWARGSCDGVFLDQVQAQGEEACLDLCKDDPDCLWFTYNEDDSTCTLLQECPFLDDRCSTCASGQKQCSERQDFSFMVTVGGWYKDVQSIDDVYMLDLESSASTCDAMAPYPVEMHDATSAWLEGDDGDFAITLCGGGQGDSPFPPTSTCYRYDRSTNTWGSTFEMDEPRFRPRSSIIRDTWFITGGYNGGALTTTIKFAKGGDDTFVAGPDLPTPMQCHCQLTINSSDIFFSDTLTTGSSYLLDWDSEDWMPLPAVPRTRTCPACGLIQSEAQGPEVVVAGSGTSDIFSLTTLTWKEGPPMLEDLTYISSAQLLDTFMALGGIIRGSEDEEVVDSIYRFNPERYSWEIESTRLLVPCALPAAVLVPEGYVDC